MNSIAKPIALLLLLAGCSSSGGGSNSGYCTPGIGQWCDYGGTEPTINGNSFAFPTSSSALAGYFYTKLPAQVGQTLTLDYTITGTNPVWQQSASGGDTNPATISLLLWRSGDDLSCQGSYAFYRFFVSHAAGLQLGGHQVINAVLNSPPWTNCFNQTDAAAFAAALQNQLGIGFAFGGKNFDGHGVYLSSGSATFTINSFTVQ